MTAQKSSGSPSLSRFLQDGKPTALGILDMVDVHLWVSRGLPAGSDWVGPMATVLFGVVGAWPEEVNLARMEDWPEEGADEILLRSDYGTRTAPVVGLARRVLTEGAKAMRTVSKSDRLMVNHGGEPITDELLESRFRNFAKRMGFGGCRLSKGLRVVFREWVEESGDDPAIAVLCRLRGRAAAGLRRGEAAPTMAHLRSILEEFHPLGMIPRPLLHHAGALDRAQPDRAFRKLSAEAASDIEAVRAAPRALIHPTELLEAVDAATAAGRRAAEIADHYGIPARSVDAWLQGLNRDRLPLRIHSHREALLTHLRRHPDKTVLEVQAWMEKQRGVRIADYSLRDFGARNGHRFAPAAGRLQRKSYRKALLNYLRQNRQATAHDFRAFASESLGLNLSDIAFRRFAKRNGFRLTPRRPGPGTEPARSLLLARNRLHPEETADDAAAWLASAHNIVVKPVSLPGFAKVHGIAFASKRKKAVARPAGAGQARPDDDGSRRVGPETEPYRSAILAHVAANPQETSRQVRDWVEEHLRLRTTKAGFRDFAARHQLKFASRFPFAAEADELLLEFMRDRPDATLPEARSWISAHLGRSVTAGQVASFAKRKGFQFAPCRRGPASEPARSLLLARNRLRPRETAEDAAAWLEGAHGIVVKPVSLPGFAKAHGRTFGSKRRKSARPGAKTWPAAPKAKPARPGKRRSRVGPETEPYRSAILAHVAANPQKTASQVQHWAEDDLGLRTTASSFDDFAKRHNFKFAPARTFATEADELLLGFLRSAPRSTMPEARTWISGRLGRPVSSGLMSSFSRRHGHRFPQARLVVDVEPARTRLLSHIRATPSSTVTDVQTWAKCELSIDVTIHTLWKFAYKYGVSFKPIGALTKRAHRRELERFLSEHPGATVRDAQAWCRSSFKDEIELDTLWSFANARGHRFAPSWLGPNTEPYRTELLKWMARHPQATASLARKWLFDRFGVDIRLRSLHRFAKRNGRKFVNGNQARQRPGAAKRLARIARLIGLGNPSVGPRRSERAS